MGLRWDDPVVVVGRALGHHDTEFHSRAAAEVGDQEGREEEGVALPDRRSVSNWIVVQRLSG